jgi:diphthine-ammonia ligase
MAESQKFAALFSGGKDSTFAIQRAMEQGRQVSVLVTLKSKNPASVMYHVPNIDFAKLQAKAIGIPQIFRLTEGVKEKDLADLKLALQEAVRKYKITGLVFGAVSSEQLRYKIESICADLGLKTAAPLWHLDPERYLTEMVREGFEIIIISCTGSGFTPNWLGRKLDLQAIQDLKQLHHKFGVHISGEGGEFKTIVVDGPIFKKRLEIKDAEKVWSGDSGFYIVKKAKLVAKK